MTRQSHDKSQDVAPRIGVVIPCYNSGEWIDRALASVVDQSWPEKRVIVVDDGSTDASADKVRAWGDRVILESGPNRGACHARNRGMAIAKAEGCSHVLFLDADDYLEGEMLAGAAEVAGETGADIVLTHNPIVYGNGQRDERVFYKGEITPETFFRGWFEARHFAPVAVLMRIEFVEATGGWDESLARAQDTEMFLRAMFFRPKIVMNDRGRAIYTRANPDSVSQRAVSRRANESRYRAMQGILKRMPGTPLEPLMPPVQDRFYTIVRAAFRLKQTDLAREGLKELRATGFRGHIGTTPHKMLAGLIGLEAKVRLLGS